MFDFIIDHKFRSLLERDWQELRKCLEIGASKSVLVLAGSIVEASLIEYFLQFRPTGYTDEKIYKLTFQSLLDLAESEGLLTMRDKNLAWVVKDYRNLIHPGKEVRKKETLSIEEAKVSEALVSIVMRAIEEKYTLKYGKTADEVMNRLKHDWEYRTIYGKIILKLHEAERVKLLDLLVQNEILEKSFWDDVFISEEEIRRTEITELEFTKPFVTELKPLISKDTIMRYLARLLNEVESGAPLNAFCLYNLFHEELNYLDQDEVDTIATYLLAIFLHVSNKAQIVIDEKSYSTIGKYVSTENCRYALRKLTLDCAVNFAGKDIGEQIDLFEQLYNSLHTNEREIVQATLTDYYSKWPVTARERERFYLSAVEKGFMVGL